MTPKMNGRGPGRWVPKKQKRGLQGIGKSKLLDRPPRPDQPDPKLRTLLSTFERSLGGRPAIQEALEGAEHPPVQRLAMLMADPRYGGQSLAKLCGLAQLSISQFLQAFTKEAGARAYTAAIHEIHKKLPAIAADMATRALPHMGLCPDCLGLRYRRDEKQRVTNLACLRCEGLGKVEVAPDTERVKLAAQVGGLIKGGTPSVAVQVNQNVNVGDGSGSSVEFREAMGKLLYPGRQRTLPDQTAEAPQPSEPQEPPIDAEPADPKIAN